MVVPLSHYLALSVALFALGVIGVIIRRNAIVILMSIEMMLNAVNLAFIGFSDYFKAVDGQTFVFFVLTVAAAEVAVGLALIVAIFRNRGSIYVDDLNILRW
ncbi:MAG: NADH-quinone oxidoreductase subunit NuoK [Desulfobaccales bacterium]|jgi:NADH-quinone oxidoreductase subunit K